MNNFIHDHVRPITPHLFFPPNLQYCFTQTHLSLHHRQGDYGFDLIDLLVGFDNAETQLQNLVDVIDAILNDDVNQHPAFLKDLALKLILSLVTVTDNVSQNTILEYLMIHPNVFDTVVKLLASPNLRVPHGYDALLLLTILVSCDWDGEIIG